MPVPKINKQYNVLVVEELDDGFSQPEGLGLAPKSNFVHCIISILVLAVDFLSFKAQKVVIYDIIGTRQFASEIPC